MASWPPSSIRQRLTSLEGTEGAVRNLDKDLPDEVQQSMARYLVVRSAGYIESVRDDSASLYAKQKSDATVHRKVNSNLYTGQGAAPGQLLTFVASFEPGWKQELETWMDADDALLKSQLGALIAARKKIAHGDGESVTTLKALIWCQTAKDVGKWITQRFDPSRKVADPVSGAPQT